MQISNFPVTLFDIDDKVIPINSISKSNSYFIRSYQIFKVEILEDEDSLNKIYSVKRNPDFAQPNLFLIDSAKSFNFVNFAYSIFITSDVTLKVTGNDGISRIFNIIYRPDNVLDETQEHYNDLLVNNFLPNLEELEPAIISQNKAEIIKRLLLDFKNIINKKGTITGITKFLNLIGFNPESINVYAEYQVNSNNSKDNPQVTITPNKKYDNKTGNYHVIYDNWITNPNDKYTIKNLPKRIININDLEDFFIKLEKAISLANIYFTLPEQDISFFGLNNSANIEKYLSIAGNTSILYDMDFHNFRKKININVIKYSDSNNFTYLVKRNLQQKRNCSVSEIKTYSNSLKPNDELYLVTREIFDNTPIDSSYDITKVESIFGSLLHLLIESNGTYCEYTIENINNPLTKIQSSKIFLTGPIELNIVTKKNGTYKISVNIYDIHNNREKYTYFYDVTNNDAEIDFEVFNSSKVFETFNNDISIDVNSTSVTMVNTGNYSLGLSDVPLDLKDYYTKNTAGLILTYLQNNSKTIAESINRNFIVNDVTDTIPIDFIDNWLDILSFKYDTNYDLKLRVINDLTLKTEYLNYTDPNSYIAYPDLLFITLLDIIDQETDIVEPYIFVTTTEAGINLSKNLFDLVLINKTDNTDIVSIYDLESLQTKVPVNFDFPLFFRESTLVPDFVNYPLIDLLDISTIPVIKSIFPRLTNINNPGIDTYYLKLGDLITARPNKDYITEDTDLLWTVKNSFTNEILLQSKDYMLKYQVNENTIYTITLEFKINNIPYNLQKISLQSSFK